MHQDIIKLQNQIQSLSIREAEKKALLQQVIKVDKVVRRAEHRLTRTLKDKEIITNVLNQTIEDLQKANKATFSKNDEVEQAYENIKQLSQIGQKITAHLSVEKIVETVYANVAQLMDVTSFGIGIYNANTFHLEFPGFMDNGVKKMLRFSIVEDYHHSFIQCYKKRKPVIHYDYQKAPDPPNCEGYVLEIPQTVICIPLMMKGIVIGIVTIQSYKKNAYGDYELNLLQNLVVYISIAIANAEAYSKLSNALTKLKHTQSQLIDSEKMASLGELSAGIAHEINNPVNFIYSGVDSLKVNFTEILEVIELYGNVTKENFEEQIAEISELKEDIGFHDNVEETIELIESIESGAARTAEIVRGLKIFSRTDMDSLSLFDIHQSLDSSLILLRKQYKDRIEIVKEYGHFPKIECYPGKLNQVFMNLLSNGIQAISGNGKIFIKTKLISKHNNNFVEIKIRDTGKGIPEKIRKRIFEPFFTTKPVGKGTGLGLSISLGIIEKHSGTIDLVTKEGEGTQFTITLPLTQPKKKKYG